METFTEARPFVKNPHFHKERQVSLHELDLSTIDPPIVEIVKGFTRLTYCFSLQSCFGHFLYAGQQDMHNLNPLPLDKNIDVVEYRIAYLALCIEYSRSGRDLFHALEEVAATNPDFIQFGSADWFWERQTNSYAIQVEPREHMAWDRCYLDFTQALRVEQVRNHFFEQITTLLEKR